MPAGIQIDIYVTKWISIEKGEYAHQMRVNSTYGPHRLFALLPIV